MLSDHCLASLDRIPTPGGLIPGCLPSSMRGGRERPAALIVARPIGYSRLQQVSTELLKGVPHYGKKRASAGHPGRERWMIHECERTQTVGNSTEVG